MTQKETTNIIIKLKAMGVPDHEILEFLTFIETHNPSEDEARETLSKS